MSDEEALLAAIAANSQEDTPRLVYADWLDEHGKHIRAEFIRVQVEVARVETLPRSDLNRHIDLFRRQQELLDNHRAELLGPLAVLPRELHVEFNRGFASELTLRFSSFYKHRERLAAANPLPRIIIHDTTARVRNLLGYHLPASVSEPYAHLVAAIGTVPARTVEERAEMRRGGEVEPAAFQRFRWPRLTELDLSGCHLGDVNTATLMRAHTFPALASLDLSANYLSDEVVGVLFDSGLAPQLKRLVLGGNPIDDAGAIELAGRWPGRPDRLENLNLRYTNIGTPGRQALLARFGGRLELF
jgi:uncharacterized protein (TIGR02996 family)